jgi:hypothetical protein
VARGRGRRHWTSTRGHPHSSLARTRMPRKIAFAREHHDDGTRAVAQVPSAAGARPWRGSPRPWRGRRRRGQAGWRPGKHRATRRRPLVARCRKRFSLRLSSWLPVRPGAARREGALLAPEAGRPALTAMTSSRSSMTTRWRRRLPGRDPGRDHRVPAARARAWAASRAAGNPGTGALAALAPAALALAGLAAAAGVAALAAGAPERAALARAALARAAPRGAALARAARRRRAAGGPPVASPGRPRPSPRGPVTRW